MSEATGLFHSIDPAGDVIFSFPQNDVENEPRLLVSSKVLSLASPVFAALFRPHFREGTELLTSDAPIVMPLKDDAFDTFTILCRALHHPQLEIEMDIGLLCRLAEVSDKY